MRDRTQSLSAPAEPRIAGGGRAAATGQFGRARDASAAGRLARSAFDLLVPVAARVFLGSLVVHSFGRFPRRGAVLVVANHPATWMDGLVLREALARRPHFLVHGPLFRPAARGWFLRFYGTVPIHHADDSPAAATLNLATERACHELFDRGEVVVTFPEGISRSDWHLETFHHGAARLALRHAGRSGPAPLAVIPVGIHYHDRTAFRGGVEVSVGEPVGLAPFLREAERDPRAAERALTARLFDDLRGLVVHTSNPAIEALVKELLPLVAEGGAREAAIGAAGATEPAGLRLRGFAPGGAAASRARSLATGRAITAILERWNQEAPERLADLWRRAKRFRRMREPLRLSDRALCAGAPARGLVVTRALGLLLGLAPALAGRAFHWAPTTLTRTLAHAFAVEPSRVAFSRLVAGSVIFPATYVLAGWGIRRLTGLPHSAVATILCGVALLGVASVVHRRWLAESWMAARLAWLARTHPRLVARARAARADVIARLAATGAGAGS